jgi:hypothetical protein
MTQTSNGEAPAPAIEAITEPEARVLGWDDLTPRDMLRAKAARLFGETDPQDAIAAEQLYATPLVIWCIQTRTNPDFTWDQALDSPYGILKVSEAPPPLTDTPAGRGSASGSRRRTSAPVTPPPAPTAAPGSAPSST